MDKVREDIIDILMKYTHIPKARIDEKMSLENELGIEGSDLDMVYYDIDVKYDIDMDTDEATKINTVGELIELVKERGEGQ